MGIAVLGSGWFVYHTWAAGAATPPSAGGNLRQPLALNNGLVGWWKLDGDAKDSSGNAGDGTLTNFTFDNTTNGWVNGKFGRGLKFNGSSDYVDVGDLSQLRIDGDLTLSAWVYWDGTTSHYNDILAKRSTGTTTNYEMYLQSSSGVLGYYNGTSTYVSSYVPPVNTWTQVTATVHGTTLTLYANGTYVYATTLSGAPASLNTGSVSIGAPGSNTASEKFSGSLDDIRIYNRALADSEVARLYSGARSYMCDQTCVGQWSLDGVNHVTNLTNFTLNGTTDGWVAGHFGNGLLFDGSASQRVNIRSLPLMTKTFTYSIWFNPTTVSGAQDLISLAGGGGGNRIWLANNRLEMQVSVDGGNTGAFLASGSVTAGQWHHVVGTFDSSTVKLYLDGTQVLSASQVGTAALVSPLGYLGTYGTAEYFTGIMDDVRIYNRVLTASEVTSLYGAANPNLLIDSSLVAYFKLDESSGTAAVDTMSVTALDSSGNGRTGTLNNFATSGTSDGWISGVFGSGTLLDGTDDYISLPDLGRTSGTLDFWLDPTTASGDQRLFTQLSGASTQAGHLALNQSSGESGSLWVWDGSAWQRLAAAGTIAAGTWNHVVVEYNGATATSYVNGRLQLSAATAFAFNGVAAGIGAPFLGTTGGYFSGIVDDVRFYSRLLAPEEIASQYRLGS